MPNQIFNLLIHFYFVACLGLGFFVCCGGWVFGFFDLVGFFSTNPKETLPSTLHLCNCFELLKSNLSVQFSLK